MDFAKEIMKGLAPEEKVRPRTTRRDNPLDHWTPPVLLERAEYLRKMAAQGNGSAGETLKEFPRHAAQLSFRSRDGEAEIHEKFADVFYVLAGGATLLSGGTVAGARVAAPGEMRGDSIEGGTRQDLKPGDVAHVPAGLPHQMLVSGDKTVFCLVLKIQEAD
jgi:mannose-6-phosphate isomerase-like protein (cupin superfamily)